MNTLRLLTEAFTGAAAATFLALKRLLQEALISLTSFPPMIMALISSKVGPRAWDAADAEDTELVDFRPLVEGATDTVIGVATES